MTSYPKPEKRAATKRRRERQDAQRAKAFREIVWERADGMCQQCRTSVLRPAAWGLSWSPRLGHVHHLRGRNVAPEDRYNPDKAVLLCAACHRAVHDGKIKLGAREGFL